MLSSFNRGLIYRVTGQVWPGCDGRLIEAVVLVESGGDPAAISSAGAVGLMQVTPAAAEDVGIDPERLIDPEINLRAGVGYLRLQFDKMAEIPHAWDRMSFALAAYNCGRGWVNIALALARRDCGARGADKNGAWQMWGVGGLYLLHPDCRKGGRRPDAGQALVYVARVRATYDRLNKGVA